MAVEGLGEPDRGIAARATLGTLIEKDEKAAVGHGVFRQWQANVRALLAMQLDLAQARGGPNRRLKPLQEIDVRQTLTLARVPNAILNPAIDLCPPERQTMELATQTHLTQMLDALNYRLRDLRAESHAADQAELELTGASAHEVMDPRTTIGEIKLVSSPSAPAPLLPAG